MKVEFKKNHKINGMAFLKGQKVEMLPRVADDLIKRKVVKSLEAPEEKEEIIENLNDK